MQIKEYERDLDILCDRIGEASFDIKEMLQKQSEWNTYDKDFSIIELLYGEEKKSLLSMIRAMLIVDPNYRAEIGGMTKMSYSICRAYEKEQEEDKKELKKLEQMQWNRTIEIEEAIEEKERLQEKMQKLKQNNLFYQLEIISTVVMMIASGILYLYLYQMYGMAYELIGGFTLLVGLTIIVLLIQLRLRTKKKQRWIRRQERRMQILEENERIQEERKKLRLQELYTKYEVNSYAELESLFELYEKKKQKIEEASFQLIKIGLLEALKRKGIQNTEFFMNVPMIFMEDEMMQRVKAYIEARKTSLENTVYCHIMGQKEDMAKMNEMIERYPHLKEHAQTALEGYGLKM